MQTTPDKVPLPARTASSASRSVLAADLKIKGDMTSDGTIEVLARLKARSRPTP